jgi:hypothetical protein
VFAVSLPLMIRDSRCPMRPVRTRTLPAARRVVEPEVPPARRVPVPTPELSGWRAAIVVTSFVVLWIWAIRAARPRAFARR